MRFNISTIILGAIALLSSAAAALSATDVVNDLAALTSKTLLLQAPASSINILNGPLYILGIGPFPTIVTGLTDIEKTGGLDAISMLNVPALTDPTDESNIYYAYRAFTSAQVTLFTTLNNKADLFAALPLIGLPIASVLRLVKGTLDTLSLNVLTLAPNQAVNIAFQQALLDEALSKVINTYDGLELKKRAVPFKA